MSATNVVPYILKIVNSEIHIESFKAKPSSHNSFQVIPLDTFGEQLPTLHRNFQPYGSLAPLDYLLFSQIKKYVAVIFANRHL